MAPATDAMVLPVLTRLERPIPAREPTKKATIQSMIRRTMETLDG
jgi:hypothetical protein